MVMEGIKTETEEKGTRPSSSACPVHKEGPAQRYRRLLPLPKESISREVLTISSLYSEYFIELTLEYSEERCGDSLVFRSFALELFATFAQIKDGYHD